MFPAAVFGGRRELGVFPGEGLTGFKHCFDGVGFSPSDIGEVEGFDGAPVAEDVRIVVEVSRHKENLPACTGRLCFCQQECVR